MTETDISPEPKSPEPPVASASASTSGHEKRNMRVIWLLLAASFVVMLNETIMSVALPELMVDLRIDARAVQWLSTAFMLTMAVVIPTTGFLLQRYNTRPVFIWAMTVFSLGTLLAAIAPGFGTLLVARVIQAGGTAVMMSLLTTTLMTLVPAAKRGVVMGNVSIVMSVAPAIGPTIAGVILHSLSWRWMFWLVLPIALVMLLLGIRRVRNVAEIKRTTFDLASVVLSALGFAGLVYGLSLVGADSEGPSNALGLGAMPMLTSLAVGGLGLGSFVWRQLRLQRLDRALLDLRPFRSANFTVSIAMTCVSMMALFGTIILLPLYLQQVLGLEPVQIGLLLLPGGVLMGVVSPFVGRLYDRYSAAVLLVPGSALVSGVLWALTFVTEDTPPMMILVAHVTLSLGLGLLFTPLFAASLGSVPRRLYSHGSAILGTVEQVAAAAGTAFFVTVMATQTTALLAGGATGAAAQAGGVRAAFLVGAIVSLFGFVAAFFIRKPFDPSESIIQSH